MTKKILNLCFGVFVMITLYTFLSRQGEERATTQDSPSSRALITLDGLSLLRYKGQQIASELHADLGQFVDPNAIELYGNVRGLDHDFAKDKTSQLSSEFAFAVFEADKFSDLLETSKVEKVYFEDSVEILHNDFILSSEQAEYKSKTETIETQDPVDIRGVAQWLTGSEGMTYSLKDEVLEIFGVVEGQSVGLND